ncbi:MAG: TetR/AcrR family transcriptional regulator [Hyphomicrobiaceae bacterium]|nr:TetR/AcrR family transcriptional regulator [Hyphomicrobiaceae bacterium]
MINETHATGRVIKAALDLAAERPWQDVALRDIADRAKVPLADVRKDFAGKPAILAKFIRLVDDAVLEKAPGRDPGQPARDRVFDVLMTRLEVLEPYKSAIRSIADTPGAGLSIAKNAMASQAWMLHAAGIGTDGPLGTARVAGLASIYASLLRTWLDETDPAYPRTMASLDRRLKRGEAVLRSLNDVQAFAGRLADVFKPRRPSQHDTPPAPEPIPTPPVATA